MLKAGFVCLLMALLAVGIVFTSCSSQYNIAGNTSVPMLDGKILYLKAVSQGKPRKIDSCEVVHGKFKFSGLVDSTLMAELYMDDESVMPVVIEDGNLKMKINMLEQNVSGGWLNDRLYEFIAQKARIEDQMAQNAILNGQRCIADDVNRKGLSRCNERQIQLENQLMALESDFVRQNFDNVLGPSIFMFMCLSDTRPQMHRQIRALIDEAPEKFLRNPYINHYLKQINYFPTK